MLIVFSFKVRQSKEYSYCNKHTLSVIIQGCVTVFVTFIATYVLVVLPSHQLTLSLQFSDLSQLSLFVHFCLLSHRLCHVRVERVVRV